MILTTVIIRKIIEKDQWYWSALEESMISNGLILVGETGTGFWLRQENGTQTRLMGLVFKFNIGSRYDLK